MRALKMFVLLAGVAAGSAWGATFTVNSTGDQPDANTADNVCSIAGGPTTCTFRAAIQQAAVRPARAAT